MTLSSGCSSVLSSTRHAFPHRMSDRHMLVELCGLSHAKIVVPKSSSLSPRPILYNQVASYGATSLVTQRNKERMVDTKSNVSPRESRLS